MSSFESAIKREEVRAAAVEEWSYCTKENKAFVSYLLSLGKKVDNPNNSAILYALGITDDYIPGKAATFSRGGAPDSIESSH